MPVIRHIQGFCADQTRPVKWEGLLDAYREFLSCLQFLTLSMEQSATSNNDPLIKENRPAGSILLQQYLFNQPIDGAVHITLAISFVNDASRPFVGVADFGLVWHRPEDTVTILDHSSWTKLFVEGPHYSSASDSCGTSLPLAIATAARKSSR